MKTVREQLPYTLELVHLAVGKTSETTLKVAKVMRVRHVGKFRLKIREPIVRKTDTKENTPYFGSLSVTLVYNRPFGVAL